MIEHFAEERLIADEDRSRGRGAVGEGSEDLRGVSRWSGKEQHSAARSDRQVHDDGHGQGMGEGQGSDRIDRWCRDPGRALGPRRFAGSGEPEAALSGVGQEVEVGQHGHGGRSGGPAGREVGRGVLLGIDGWPRQLGRASEELGEPEGRDRGRTGGDLSEQSAEEAVDGAEFGQLGHGRDDERLDGGFVDDGGGQGLVEIFEADEDLGLGQPELTPEIGGARAGSDGGGDAADPVGAVEGDHELGAAREGQGHHVALGEPQEVEPGGEGGDEVVELAKGQGGVEAPEGLPRGPSFSDVGQHPAEGDRLEVRVLGDVVGPAAPRPEPGAALIDVEGSWHSRSHSRAAA